MNIGVFTNCYTPLVNGVVGTIGLLKRGFVEQGHQVYIFAPGYDHYVDREENVFRYPALDLTKKVKFPVAVPFSPKINRVLDTVSLDIIHSHHPFVLGPASLRVAGRKRIPAVYTFHTQFDQYAHYVPLPGPIVRAIAKYRVKKFCGAVDRITAPSESARRILESYGVARAVRVIPNPTDLARFRNNDGGPIRRKYGLGSAKLLINIGRVAPEKNLSFLLTAYQLIWRACLGHHGPAEAIRLLIVGGGPDLPSLKRQAGQLGLSDTVIFTGAVDPAEIPNYLAAADLFVMASTTEVKPLALLEALAAGVPVAAVSAPGADDTIIHGVNGLLVEQEASKFAETVLDLISDPERLHRYKTAALKTAGEYSYAKIAGDYLELYREAISQKPDTDG